MIPRRHRTSPQPCYCPLGTQDLSQVSFIHPEMRVGDVLVGRGLYGLFQRNQKRVVDFTPNRTTPPRWQRKKRVGRSRSRWLRSLGVQDQGVEWYWPSPRAPWLSPEQYAALPVLLAVRELRYSINRPGFRVKKVTLVITLLDAEVYPVQTLADLHGQRWQAETNRRHLKSMLGMNVLRCQTESGVMKERTLYAVAYHLVRLVLVEAAHRQGVEPQRVSFVDALRWLVSSPAGTPLPETPGAELPFPDPATRRVAPTTTRQTGCGLTEWHSGRTLFS